MRSNWTLLVAGVASLVVTSANLAADTGARAQDECDTARSWAAGANYRAGDRIVTLDYNFYECKGGAATALCDDPGYQPDVDERATDAWELLYRCPIADGYEARVVGVTVSSPKQCQAGRTNEATLTATIANDSPFAGSTKVAFYHSASKTLIASVDLEIPEEFTDSLKVSAVLKNPPLVADITVVADDDGTGRGNRLEYNESDNFRAVKLLTCIPKLGPL